jgi:mono/diheme cytochrome c family protein
MRARFGLKHVLLLLLLLIAALWPVAPAQAQSSLNPGYAAQDAQYSPSARAGREIWFFATAFNDRFYTYSYPQRLGAAIDWFKVLAAKNKRDLFQGWGITPDPDCCVPGDPNCPARTLDETYGFQYCKGDEELLKFVGKEGYRDPGCDFKDADFNPNTPHGAKDQRQDPCDLRFGTSTGALGLRKFPNPRFDAQKWRDLNGSLASWEKYGAFIAENEKDGDSRTNRLFDGSIEPPFRIGMSCGACHVSYNPVKPPADPSNPKWENIDGLVGNQYSRISQLLASGMSQHVIEWQLIARTRPGTVDTSALPMDTVSNPGTMNAIANFNSRPKFEYKVLKWRKASQCPGGPAEVCWCEPEKPGKCWERGETLDKEVRHILKGGEDTVGPAEAIQRVYFNIGSCAEQCWLNHLPDLRAIDPTQRNYGQTPFDIGQCRRDCASFRAIEDRLENVVAFFQSARPADLAAARNITQQQLETQLNQEFGPGAVAQGQKVFARTCAGCHSSQANVSEATNFRAPDPADPTLRLDFLSNEKPILASGVGTNAARAMHSNHMKTRVWDEYTAPARQALPPDPAVMEVMKGGGRGYYRPPSLLSVWAYAPLMLNNAMGPEVCGKPSNPEIDFYSSPYVDKNDKPLANPPPCVPFDPSVEGRYRLFKDSMDQLLNAAKRVRKVNLADRDIIVDIAPKVQIKDIEASFSIKLPKGTPAVLINSLRYKDMLQDIVLAQRDPARLQAKYSTILTPARFAELTRGLDQLRLVLGAHRGGQFTLDITQPKAQADFIQAFYSNVLGRAENTGHLFGEKLSERDKRALIAFLATL